MYYLAPVPSAPAVAAIAEAAAVGAAADSPMKKHLKWKTHNAAGALTMSSLHLPTVRNWCFS